MVIKFLLRNFSKEKRGKRDDRQLKTDERGQLVRPDFSNCNGQKSRRKRQRAKEGRPTTDNRQAAVICNGKFFK